MSLKVAPQLGAEQISIAAGAVAVAGYSEPG